MQSFQDSAGPAGNSSVSGENPDFEVATGWESSNKTPQRWKLVQLANQKVPLDFILKKYNVHLERSSSNSGWSFKCSCPFDDHNDRSPSFGYNPKENAFNCFGCHRGGGPVEFVAYKEGKSKLGIAQELLRIYGVSDIEIEEFDSFDYERLQEILFDFADFILEFKRSYALDDEALKYAKAVTWNLDVYLRKHAVANTIILPDLEARVLKLKEQIQVFGG